MVKIAFRRTCKTLANLLNTMADGNKLRNIELKATLRDAAGFEQRVAIAKQLTGTDGTVIVQHDVFFDAAKGRLKLRYIKTDQDTERAELISYDRPDEAGPKLSLYSKYDVNEPKLLEQVLAETVGVRGRVDKTRLLFLHDQVRIHLDNVVSLGYYLEFEVVLKPEQTIEQGQTVVDEMKRLFQITDDQLITGAYMDLLDAGK
uniref:CYTH domain-containing protein n=1 Tax=Anopheles farauti TaxID=69004 RepID=A0A182Q3K9_9DIPT